MFNVLAVGFGGFLGSILRYLIGLIPVTETCLFPIKTFSINVLGCFVIGMVTLYMSKHLELSPYMSLFLKVGLCGGFTTFSTFALETTDLLKSGHVLIAALYVALSVMVGIAVIFAVEYFAVK